MMIKELKRFGKYVSEVMDEWRIPGLAIAIVKDKEVILCQGSGSRNLDKELKVTPETLFAIGSCTKAFTTMAMSILVDEGKLDWDKPVRHYLPTFKLYDSYATEHMTPRDLVIHRSGLPRHDFVWYGSSFDRDELFGRLQYLEPSREFRSVYQYQNLMYMTAGYLVGQISGSSWERFIHQRILEPLGMEHTNFSVITSQESPNFALPHYIMDSDELPKELPFRNTDAIGPASSMNSCVRDMTKWISLNLNKGKYGEDQIVSEESLGQMHSPQMAIQEPIKYDELLHVNDGMGWGIQPYRGYHMIQHRGGIDGFSALVSLMPRDNIGVVVLTNLGDAPIVPAIVYKAYDLLLGLDEIPWDQRIRDEVSEAKRESMESRKKVNADRKAGTKPSHSLEDYTGRYENPGYGVMVVKLTDDYLEADYNSVSQSELKHYHYDVFTVTIPGGTFGIVKITFSTDVHGDIDSLSMPLEESVSDIVFARVHKEV